MFFRKKPAPPEKATFKQRVEAFWREFAKEAPDLHALVEGLAIGNVPAKTDEIVRLISPISSWVYGPGKVKGNHSFTLSPEGCSHLRLLTEYWLQQAPNLTGWDFFAARQSSELTSIKTSAGAFAPLEIWVTAEIDEEDEKIDLTVWCPRFAEIPEKERWQVVYLWLDAAVGEDCTTFRFGDIEIHDRALARAFPLTELREFTEQAERSHGWKQARLDSVTTFRFSKPAGAFPRGEMLLGRTSQPKLWNEYLRSKGEIADPLAGAGAAYHFLQLPLNGFPGDQEIDAHMDLQELLAAELVKSGDGIGLGGGFGQNWWYIDLLLFDGRRSTERVMEILRRDGTVKQATLHAFAGTPEEILATL